MSDRGHKGMNEDVDAIIKLAQEYDLDALTIVDGEFELSITRREPQVVSVATQSAPVLAALPDAPAASVPVASAEAPLPQGNVVSAPIIGVFYRAGAPTSPPFVSVGDRVTAGQTLCILEAMKLMNEITTDFSGVVTAIHVENADLVTIGQPLFTIGNA